LHTSSSVIGRNEMKKLLPLICLSISACAQTPSDVVIQNNSYTFTSSKTPATVSRCLVKSIENTSSGFKADDSDEGNGAYEVIGRVIASNQSTFAVYQIKPHKNGSSITAYVSGNALGNKRKFAEKIAQPCL
jgi:hypothetical protein